jgi:hypothetical protein
MLRPVNAKTNQAESPSRTVYAMRARINFVGFCVSMKHQDKLLPLGIS